MTMQASRSVRYQNRATRAEFWRVQAFVWIIGAIYLAIHRLGFDGIPEMVGDVRIALLAVIFIMLAIPAITVTIRRLHDIDYSGWLVLVALIPVLGFMFLVVLGCLPGTPGPNRFGPDPLGREFSRLEPLEEEIAATAEAQSAPTTPTIGDVIGEIERLAHLKATGALTETEFEVMKAQALGRGMQA